MFTLGQELILKISTAVEGGFLTDFTVFNQNKTISKNLNHINNVKCK